MNDEQLTWLASQILCAMIGKTGQAPTEAQIATAAACARELEHAVRTRREQAGMAAG
jgi:hypothetical protein